MGSLRLRSLIQVFLEQHPQERHLLADGCTYHFKLVIPQNLSPALCGLCGVLYAVLRVGVNFKCFNIVEKEGTIGSVYVIVPPECHECVSLAARACVPWSINV